jgi:hypothetical protein
MGKYTLIPSILLCMFVSGCKSNEELFLDACSNGNYQKVIQILKQGVDKDMQADGMTCLMAAAGNGHADIVEKLLALDANTELTDRVGNTAIDYATHYGHHQIAEMITQQQEAKRQARQQQEEAERFASLSEQDKQQIFLELTQTWERGGEGKSELLIKYNITEEHLKAIQREGLTNDWPTAEPTPTPQPTPTPKATPTPKNSRQEQIEKQFSAWDGSHYGLVKYVKNMMHNPKSFEHVETRYGDKGDHLVLKMVFRGTNQFNAIVTQTCYAKADLKGNILSAECE